MSLLSVPYVTNMPQLILACPLCHSHALSLALFLFFPFSLPLCAKMLRFFCLNWYTPHYLRRFNTQIIMLPVILWLCHCLCPCHAPCHAPSLVHLSRLGADLLPVALRCLLFIWTRSHKKRARERERERGRCQRWLTYGSIRREDFRDIFGVPATTTTTAANNNNQQSNNNDWIDVFINGPFGILTGLGQG